MGLSANVPRCQGRTALAAGSSTLCRDCVDCARRTDIPTGFALEWMQPPPMARVWFSQVCSGYIAPDDEVIE